MKVTIDEEKVGLSFTKDNFPEGSFFTLYNRLYIVVRWISMTIAIIMPLCDHRASEEFCEDLESKDYFRVEVDEIKAHLK